MFSRLPDSGGARIAIDIDGVTVEARAGDSVAAALLASGRTICRVTPMGAAPRGPYCLVGACFECLVTIDGVPNLRACVVPAVAGMRIETIGGRSGTGTHSR